MRKNLNDRCRHCRRFLPKDHTAPCPHCGGKGRILDENLEDGLVIATSGEVSTTRVERNIRLSAGILLLELVAAIGGFWLAGWIGAVVAMSVAVILLIAGPHAATKVRELSRF